MSDLYRITDRCDTPNCTKPHVHDRNGYRRHWEKVEPCEHGNFVRHIIEDSVRAAELVNNPFDAIAWCDGAGLL